MAEMAGVRNSFGEAAEARLRVAHQAELEQALAQAKAEHDQAFAVAVDGLAREIVSNIAASLLGGGGSTGTSFGAAGLAGLEAASARLTGTVASGAGSLEASATPDGSDKLTSTPQPAEPAPESTTVEDDLVLDEAWIETVRCTSCNECTNLNGMLFAYDQNKQAYIKDPAGGPYRDLVVAAEKCPAAIIHPGKPLNPDEPHLQELLERAKPFL
jgi:ferredoxin